MRTWLSTNRRGSTPRTACRAAHTPAPLHRQGAVKRLGGHAPSTLGCRQLCTAAGVSWMHHTHCHAQRLYTGPVAQNRFVNSDAQVGSHRPTACRRSVTSAYLVDLGQQHCLLLAHSDAGVMQQPPGQITLGGLCSSCSGTFTASVSCRCQLQATSIGPVEACSASSLCSHPHHVACRICCYITINSGSDSHCLWR
jgi:hypothetical protein